MEGGVLVGEGTNPDIAKVGDRLIVVWEGNIDNNYNDIYAQLLSLNGDLLWNASSEVLCDVSWEQYEPQIVTDGIDDIYVGWMDARIYNNNEYVGSIPSIFAQKVHIELTYSPDEILSAIKGELFQNYPNPLNPTTTFSFSIPEEGIVELSVYNIKGQKIKTLLSDQISMGEHSIVWNGKDVSVKRVSSGVYLHKLKVNDKTE